MAAATNVAVVQRIDPSSIAGIIEANINAYLHSFARLPGAIFHRDAQSSWVDSGLQSTVFNAITWAHLDADNVETRVDSVLAHFKQLARPVTWHVGPTTLPANLGEVLLAHSMTFSESEPGMAVELEHVDLNGDNDHPKLIIEEVRDGRGLRDWVGVWLFPVPDEIRCSCFDALLHRGLGHDTPWRYYVGYMNGKAVSTSEIFFVEGVAAVHYVVTLREMRRLGIGTAMTMHVLKIARTEGYHVAVLTASDDGHGLYQRIGFRDYCVFSGYEWEPDQGG